MERDKTPMITRNNRNLILDMNLLNRGGTTFELESAGTGIYNEKPNLVQKSPVKIFRPLSSHHKVIFKSREKDYEEDT